MRKVFITMSLLLTLCLFSISILGYISLTNRKVEAAVPCEECGQENCICLVDTPNIKGLDSNTIFQIKQDYKEYLSYFKKINVGIQDISIIKYYGTYSGHYNVTSIAIKFNVRNMDYLKVKHEFLIGQIGNKTRFIYPDSNAIMIWCRPDNPNISKWNIHRLQTAVGYGYLTVSELKAIGALHEAETSDFYKSNRFNIELEKQIKQDYYYWYGMDKTYTYNGVEYGHTFDDVYILGYYGEYSSGAVSLMMTASGFCYFDAETSETVAGITFNYSNSNQMEVWHEGQFYKLSDTTTRDYEIIDGAYVYGEWRTVPGAYTLGLITYEELLITKALHNA